MADLRNGGPPEWRTQILQRTAFMISRLSWIQILAARYSSDAVLPSTVRPCLRDERGSSGHNGVWPRVCNHSSVRAIRWQVDLCISLHTPCAYDQLAKTQDHCLIRYYIKHRISACIQSNLFAHINRRNTMTLIKFLTTIRTSSSLAHESRLVIARLVFKFAVYLHQDAVRIVIWLASRPSAKRRRTAVEPVLSRWWRICTGRLLLV